MKAYKILGLLRRRYKHSTSVTAKRSLYISSITSRLTYCCPLWRPNIIKDIICLENIQRRATQFILHDFESDYKTRLVTLKLLPLMMEYELIDIAFFIKSLKYTTGNFNIRNYVSFSSSGTRSQTSFKLHHKPVRTNSCRHFYFNRISRLWNSLPVIDLDKPVSSILSLLRIHFWNHFLSHFSSDNPCSFHLVCQCNKCYYLPLTHNISPLD